MHDFSIHGNVKQNEKKLKVDYVVERRSCDFANLMTAITPTQNLEDKINAVTDFITMTKKA